MNLLIEGYDATKAGNRIGSESAQISLKISLAQGNATGVSMLYDDTGMVLTELVDTFLGSISIVDVVVGKRLALNLFSSGNTAWLDTGFNIKSSVLMRVLTVTHVLLNLELWCYVVRQYADLFVIDTSAAKIGCHQTIVAGGMGKCFCGQLESFACQHRAISLQLADDGLIITRVNNNRYTGIVLCRCTYHRRGTNIDVFNGIIQAAVFVSCN